jgi:DNA-binding response OmpR family regulator
MENTTPDHVVLVVDDDVEITDLLKTMLATDIHRTIISHDGRDGLEKARQYLPDLILLNVNLPNKDGREVCQILKSDPSTSHIKIIMLTGNTDAETRRQCYAMGTDNFMTKPFSVVELIEIVRKLLPQKTAVK